MACVIKTASAKGCPRATETDEEDPLGMQSSRAPLRYLTKRLEPIGIHGSTDPKVVGASSKLAHTALLIQHVPEPDGRPKTLSTVIKPSKASTSTPSTMALRSIDSSLLVTISRKWFETLTHAVLTTWGIMPRLNAGQSRRCTTAALSY
jgi:hypothetical protein